MSIEFTHLLDERLNDRDLMAVDGPTEASLRGAPWPWGTSLDRSKPSTQSGVPFILSLAFWGGIWGLVYGFVQKWFPEKLIIYLTAAILFGAIFPTLALWFVVSPLKGIAIAQFSWQEKVIDVIVNAAWGLGMGLLSLAARLLVRRKVAVR